MTTNIGYLAAETCSNSGSDWSGPLVVLGILLLIGFLAWMRRG